MGKKPKDKAITATPDEFSEPIVVPFRGMFKNPDGTPDPLPLLGPDHPSDKPTVEELLRDGASRQIEKLLRLADHYGIDQSVPDWGLYLALRVAIDHHPGFRLVYDDEQARIFHSLYGFTPVFELKGKPPRRTNFAQTGWAALSKLLQPEFLAMLVSPNRKSRLSDLEICEHLVKAADPEMQKTKNKREADSHAATLNRRLTEGRGKKKKQELPSGKKTDG